MSYAVPYTLTGNGTGTQATSSTNVAITPTSTTLPGDLIIAAVYTDQNATLVKDAGDGWVLLDSGFNSGSAFGIFLAVCIAPLAGASGYAGLTLPAAGAYFVRPTSLRLPAPYRWDLSVRAGSQGWFNATASATAAAAPAILQPYAQVIDIIGRGYNNASVATVAAITGWTERTDTGATVPPNFGVAVNDRQLSNSIQNPSVTSAISLASTNRAGVRGMVGIIGNTSRRGRFMSGRRVF